MITFVFPFLLSLVQFSDVDLWKGPQPHYCYQVRLDDAERGRDPVILNLLPRNMSAITVFPFLFSC